MDDQKRQRQLQFLNQYYGFSRWFYDISRKYYLVGRDAVLDQLAAEGWRRLVEIGPGTGRNLEYLRRRRPRAVLGGLEASDAMLEYARKRLPDVHWKWGFAEEADYTRLVGGRPDRILFSYSLSMMEAPVEALARARKSLADGGEIAVVDFGDLRGLPGPVASGLRAWLESFHVVPVEHGLLAPLTEDVQYGPGRYFVRARIPVAH